MLIYQRVSYNSQATKPGAAQQPDAGRLGAAGSPAAGAANSPEGAGNLPRATWGWPYSYEIP